MMTRTNYLAQTELHNEYYRQFVNTQILNIVPKNSQNLPLDKKDTLARSISGLISGKVMAMTGEKFLSLGFLVCVVCEAGRINALKGGYNEIS